VVVGSVLFCKEKEIKWMITVSVLNIMKIKNDGKCYLFIFNQWAISTLCFLAVPALW